jgi:hypothetical protein
MPNQVLSTWMAVMSKSVLPVLINDCNVIAAHMIPHLPDGPAGGREDWNPKRSVSI